MAGCKYALARRTSRWFTAAIAHPLMGSIGAQADVRVKSPRQHPILNRVFPGHFHGGWHLFTEGILLMVRWQLTEQRTYLPCLIFDN